MKSTKQRQEAKGPFEVIEEAFHLLRLAPAATLASYYLGSLPFVLGLLFFWSDMSRSAFAEQRLGAGAFVLSLLFFWMKTWQAVFAQELLARLSGEPAPRWTLSRLLRVGLIQAILQPSGLFLLPVALAALFPFGWTYAFYQSVTALGDGQEGDLLQVFKRAWRQAKLWPLQNHYVLFLLQPFALFVFLNLASGVLAIPFLLNKFLGMETAFSQSLSAMLNTTFFAAIIGLTYLCLDPILKAIYVLRCFYGESLQTGRDLKAELKNVQFPRQSPGVVILILLLSLMLPASLNAAECPETSRSAIAPHTQLQSQGDCVLQPRVARNELPWALCLNPFGVLLSFEGPAMGVEEADGRANTPIRLLTPAATVLERDPRRSSPEGSLSAPDLDHSIDEVLHHREFSWRMPRERIQEKAEAQKGALTALLENLRDALQDGLKAIGRWVGDFFRWLGKYLRPRPSTGSGGGTGWISTMYALLWVVAIALVCALVFLLFRVWQNRRQPSQELAAEAIVPVPDLANENVGADQLPEDGWLKLARELLEKGDLRLALRAFYLASLVHLAENHLITIAKFKSNRDYERELQRRGHAFPEVLSAFAQNVCVFDRAWYGLHEVNAELVATFAGSVEKSRSHLRSSAR